MRYGVTAFLTDTSIDVITLARALKERGLDSLWLPEHTHIPTSRDTPPPTAMRSSRRSICTASTRS